MEKDTRELAAAFIDYGFKTIITAVDSNARAKSLLEENITGHSYLTCPKT